MTAMCTPLPDGRWHFQHGPIDILIGADGEAEALAGAHQAAVARFQTILEELVGELSALRAPVRGGGPCPVNGAVARRMWGACAPHASGFITPMAAVAGSVADELMGCYSRPGVRRAWVNNGGDIALHLAAGRALRVGLCADIARVDVSQLIGTLDLDSLFTVHADQPVRGIATSGWRGRSFSMGIADSVTVLAVTAACADAAATVVANAVNTMHPAVRRQSARSVREDSDLGELPVTVDVPPLPRDEVQRALSQGLAVATALRARGVLHGALLVCQGQSMALEPTLGPARPMTTTARQAQATSQGSTP